MDATKQEPTKDKFHQIAMADWIIAEKEKTFIENLDKVNIYKFTPPDNL